MNSINVWAQARLRFYIQLHSLKRFIKKPAFCLLFCSPAWAQLVDPLSLQLNKADGLATETINTVELVSPQTISPVTKENSALLPMPNEQITYKNDATVRLQIIPGTMPLAVKLQTNVIGPAGADADTYFLNVLIDVDRDGQLRSLKPGLEEWVVHNTPVVVSEDQTTIAIAPEFHLGINDIELGPEPLQMRITLTPAPITELYWDGRQYLADGTYQDHLIEWPSIDDSPVLPALIQCPNEVNFSGQDQATFSCNLSAYNKVPLDIEYSLNRIDGEALVNNGTHVVRQVQLPPANTSLVSSEDQPNVASLQFTAYRLGTESSSWRYQARLDQSHERLSSTDVLVEFEEMAGEIAFVNNTVENIGIESFISFANDENPFLLTGINAYPKTAFYMQDTVSDGHGPTISTDTVGDDEPKLHELEREITYPYYTPPTFFTVPTIMGNSLCIVDKAILKYGNGQVIKPELELPSWATPLPAVPGGTPAPALKTGPIRGVVTNSVVDKKYAGLYLLGNAFEYQSMLNNQHGCSSQQYKRTATFYVDTNSNEINEIDKETVGIPKKTIDGKEKIVKKKVTASGLGPGWRYDGRKYAGSTYSGYSPKAPFKHYYQGTPKMIRWVDAPDIGFDLSQPKMNIVVINYGILSSITWNSGRNKGWYCKSAHLMAYDVNTQKAMPPAVANKIFGQLKISEKLSETDKKHAVFLQKNFVQLAKNAVFIHNPLFINLGCKAF